MPLYIEILDHDSVTADAALQDGADVSILSTWTSETTGETVRLVAAPDEHESPRATAHGARILFY
jgi:hypothetical protein